MLTATNNVLIDTNRDDWIRTSGPFVPNEVQKTLELFECRVIAIIKELILQIPTRFLSNTWMIGSSKMKSFSVVASIFPVIACGFIALALLDLGDRVT